MKNIFYILLFISSSLMAQVSDGFSYQSVVRDASGNLLYNQLIGLRMTLLANSALGTADYVETHQVATNGYGVVSISLGTGTVVSGVFSNVDWRNNTYFLKTELDINAGTNYEFMGISQILAVPYALHAQTASSVLGDNDTSATNEIQQLSIVGNQLVLDNGGNSVTLSGTIDLDADPTNELQALNLSNDTLYLSQGNYVLIDDYLQSLSNTAGTISISGNNSITLSDSSSTNEIQQLSIAGNVITISEANTITLPVNNDNDPINELQTLSNTAGAISISNGNTITLQDSSSVNELQILSNTAGTITITDGNTITLADSSATNELQVLTNTAGTITISDGNTITLADSSIINELQNLSLSNDTLLISSGNAVKLPIPNVPVEIPPGTIVWSESANDTALLNRNFEFIGAELKNTLSATLNIGNDTNYFYKIEKVISEDSVIEIANNGGHPFGENYNQEALPIFFNNKIFHITHNKGWVLEPFKRGTLLYTNSQMALLPSNLCQVDSMVYFFGGSPTNTCNGISNQLYFRNLNDSPSAPNAVNTWNYVQANNTPPSPRFEANLLWTGSKLIVYGGYTCAPNQSSLTQTNRVYLTDGGIYDPVTNSWTNIPSSSLANYNGGEGNVYALIGDKFFVWGGYFNGMNSNGTGAIYNLQTDLWTPISSTVYPNRSYSNFCVRGNEIFIGWGYLGHEHNSSGQVTSTISYNSNIDSWSLETCDIYPFRHVLFNGENIYQSNLLIDNNNNCEQISAPSGNQYTHIPSNSGCFYIVSVNTNLNYIYGSSGDVFSLSREILPGKNLTNSLELKYYFMYKKL